MDEFAVEFSVGIMEFVTVYILAVGDVLVVVGEGTLTDGLVGKNEPTARRNADDISKVGNGEGLFVGQHTIKMYVAGYSTPCCNVEMTMNK